MIYGLNRIDPAHSSIWSLLESLYRSNGINRRQDENRGGFKKFVKRLFLFSLALLAMALASTPAWGYSAADLKRFDQLDIDIETNGHVSYDPATNQITASDPVRMTIDNIIIEADSLTYYGNERVTEAAGNIRLSKTGVTINADELRFDHNTGLAMASGRVRLASSHEEYTSDLIEYNFYGPDGNGRIGPFRGRISGSDRDFLLHGDAAFFDDDGTTIARAGLTRCPRTDHPDYIFDAQTMRIVGDDIIMEQVIFRVIGFPVFYLPRLVLKQGQNMPKFDMSSNQGGEAAFDDEEFTQSQGLRRGLRLRIEVNTVRPSKLAVGMKYYWDRYADLAEVEFNSNGFLSLLNRYEIHFPNYALSVDGKTDLVSDPEREFGLGLARRAWQTKYGEWQAGANIRYLSKAETAGTPQGAYGGFRLDYRANSRFNLSYQHFEEISGSEKDWIKLEDPFFIINNYRLGGNLLYNLNIPLTEHYSILNKGSYSLRNSSWTSQVTGLVREVCCIKLVLGWDVAKEVIEFQFRLKY